MVSMWQCQINCPLGGVRNYSVRQRRIWVYGAMISLLKKLQVKRWLRTIRLPWHPRKILIQFKRRKKHSNVNVVTKYFHEDTIWTDISKFTLEKSHSNVIFVTRNSHIKVTWTDISKFTPEKNLSNVTIVKRNSMIKAIWMIILKFTQRKTLSNAIFVILHSLKKAIWRPIS